MIGEHDTVSGNMQAIGGLTRLAHVRVLLDGCRQEWRQVQAKDLNHAFDVAEASSDVLACLESSWFPGGVVT